jgi:hypothetical protein
MEASETWKSSCSSSVYDFYDHCKTKGWNTCEWDNSGPGHSKVAMKVKTILKTEQSWVLISPINTDGVLSKWPKLSNSVSWTTNWKF